MEILSQDTVSNYTYMHPYLHTTCIHGCACCAGLFIPGDRHALWQHIAAVLLLIDRWRMRARNAALLLALSSTWYNRGITVVSSWSLVSHKTEAMQTLLQAWGEEADLETCLWAEIENHHCCRFGSPFLTMRGFEF